MPFDEKLLDEIAEEHQDEAAKWNLSQERAFQEDLMYRGFHMFMIFFTLVMGGSVSARSQQNLCIILTLGTFISLAMMLPIYRARVKLLFILRILHRIEQHPVAKVGRLLHASGGLTSYSVVHMIGLWIPLMCCATLLFGAILAYAGIVHAS
jgi:hypothetical protein